MIIVDANFVIALLNPEDAHSSWAHKVFEGFGGAAIGISALNLAETLVRPYATGLGIAFEEALAELDFEVFPVNPENASDLAQLRASSKLRMPDAVALDLALRLGARLCTADARLASAARERKLTVVSPS